MAAYREPDGLERIMKLLASLVAEVREAVRRRRIMVFKLLFFAAIFFVLLTGETLFAAMMFSILQIEILGTVFSGAAFALMVPTVIGYVHVRLHHEGDHFTRWWLRTLSGIGILFFSLGVSLMIGYSAYLAAQDAMTMVSAGSVIGTLGGQTIGGEKEGSGIVGWIGVIPSGLLFLGLSFGMIITISFASFCLGKALQAFNVLTLTPAVGGHVTERIEAATARIAAFRKLRDKDVAARASLPFDVKGKFAREAANAAWKVGQAKLTAARRVFDPRSKNDPLGNPANDPVAGSIPSYFKTEEEFARHMAEQMDVLRLHNILRVLTGIPETGKDEI